MDKHIQRNLRRDIKHIVSMQSLLEEYDRQNKFLNKQVLELITENTRLRMDKVKASIVHDILHAKGTTTPTKNTRMATAIDQRLDDHSRCFPKQRTSEKIEEGTKKIERSSSKKLIEKFKMERESAPVRTEPAKKDEAVQTPSVQKTGQTLQTQPQIVQHNTPVKPAEQKPFSFRHPNPNQAYSPFESLSASSKEFVSQIDVKFGQSPHEKPKQQSSESQILGMSRETSHPSLQHTFTKTVISCNQSTIKRENTSHERFRCSHAIKPSPQVDTSLCKDRQYMTPSSSTKKLGARENSRSNIRPFESVQKKKKFLEIVSVSLTPSKAAKGRGSDCC